MHNLRNPDEVQNSKELLPEEIRDSEEDIIRKAQREAFPEEYDALTKGKPIQVVVYKSLTRGWMNKVLFVRTVDCVIPSTFPMMFDFR